jgi:hypothetical protein
MLANVILVLGAGAAGCESRLCAPEGIASSGKVVSATIVEIYDQNSSFTYQPQLVYCYGPPAPCPGTDGLVQGASVEFRTAGLTDNGTKNCQLIAAKAIAVPAPITIDSDDFGSLASAQVEKDPSVIYSAENVSVNGCDGAYAFAIMAGDGKGGIFATPVQGAPPPAILFRLFLPSSNGSCQTCFDNFVVQLSEGM